MVREHEKEENNYTVTFVYPYGPPETFYWPKQQDGLSIPFQHTLCVIKTLEITSHTDRLNEIGMRKIRKTLVTAGILSRKIIKNYTSSCYFLNIYENCKLSNLN